MNRIRILLDYFLYYLKAQTRHDIHSPFVYNLLTEVINSNMHYYAYDNIESIRSSLLLSDKELVVQDFGAGSQIAGGKRRKVRDIVRNSAKPRKYGQLLFRLVNKFQPETMLELGTSLGISTLYQAGASSKARFITLEGSEEIAEIARENFRKLRLDNVELLGGRFTETLPEALSRLGKLDYVFFDGDHRRDATLEYFRQCLDHAHNDSLFVFDDIHWSAEMEQAWEIIKEHPRVTVSIDMFFIGLVFFRKEQVPQAFTIRF
jgi:predicted O-methyltransferase YrrM